MLPKLNFFGPTRSRGQGHKPADKPTLSIWLPKPELANGAAIVICPGGGYGGLAVDHEGR